MTGLAKKTLPHIGTVVIILTVMLALSFIIISQIMGWKISTVYGAGMSPTFGIGDAVVVESADADAIALDDIMVYYSPLDGNTTMHRVIGMEERDDGLFFRTRGDSSEDEDPYIVSSENVTGRIKFKVPVVGYFNHFSRTPLGLIMLIVLPALIVFTSEINTLFKTLIPQEKMVRRMRRKVRWSTGMRKKDWIQ